MRIILILFLLTSSIVHGEESIDKIFNFSEDIRAAVLKSPAGNPMPDKNFYLNPIQADQMKALAAMDDTTRIYLENKKTEKDCEREKILAEKELEKKIEKREFKIHTSVLTNDLKYEQEAIGRFMSNEYINYIGHLAIDGNKKAFDIYSLEALEQTYKKNNPHNDLSKMDFKEKEILLNQFANQYLGVKLPDGLLMKEMVFSQMVEYPANWKESLAAAKDMLSSEQKIQLVSKVGGFFGNYYNYTRFNEGLSAKGFVTTEELFNSLKNGNEGGICRDIALAQTQILKELGFKDNYVVTYKTLSGAHSVVISKDPTNGKIIKFNYDESIQIKEGSGTQALIQDTTMPDHGLTYRIHDSEGKPVTIVSSELGLILKDSTGGETRAFTDRHYSLAKVGIKLGGIDGNFFTGKTSKGENIYGLALFKKVESEYLTIDGGVAVSKLTGDRTFVRMDQENFYARISTEVRTPKFINGDFSAQAFVGADAEILNYNARETSTSSTYQKSASHELDGKAEGKIGVAGSLRLDADTLITNKTYATFYPEFNHVADTSTFSATKDALYIQSGVEKKIFNNQAVLVDTVVMLKNYGTSMGIKTAYEDRDNLLRLKAGVEAPMSKNTPTFLPGGSTKLNLAIDKETKSGSVFSIEYDRDLTNRNSSLFLKASKKF